MKIINYTQVVEDDAYVNVGAYIIDLIAAIRAVSSFSTVEELINWVLSIIPRDYGRVYISWQTVTGKSLGKSPQEQLDLKDHLSSLSQQKLKSDTPMSSYIITKTNLSLSNFSLTGLLAIEGKH